LREKEGGGEGLRGGRGATVRGGSGGWRVGGNLDGGVAALVAARCSE